KSTHVEKITPAIDVSFFKSEGTNFNEQVNFLTVARLHWKKGLIETLQALAELKKSKYHFTYTIVGDGIDKERIAYAINQLGLKDYVFMVGKKSHKDLLSLYKKSNIYIQYSISEGFCNAVLEAQSMGLLCVVSDAEGLSENVIHGQTGWVVPKNDYLCLTNTLMEVINLPLQKKKKIQETAINRVKNNFNLEQQQKAFLRFYNFKNN
ncbi:MAG: glycosyltransferase, partial [Flavobacteriaceae bacterium]